MPNPVRETITCPAGPETERALQEIRLLRPRNDEWAKQRRAELARSIGIDPVVLEPEQRQRAAAAGDVDRIVDGGQIL
jgi:hypothetical protein